MASSVITKRSDDNKADYVNLGVASDIGGAWDNLSIVERPVVCRWNASGVCIGLLFKYNGGQYGMGIGKHYYGSAIQILSVADGTKTITTVTGT